MWTLADFTMEIRIIQESQIGLNLHVVYRIYQCQPKKPSVNHGEARRQRWQVMHALNEAQKQRRNRDTALLDMEKLCTEKAMSLGSWALFENFCGGTLKSFMVVCWKVSVKPRFQKLLRIVWPGEGSRYGSIGSIREWPQPENILSCCRIFVVCKPTSSWSSCNTVFFFNWVSSSKVKWAEEMAQNAEWKGQKMSESRLMVG